MTMNGAMVDLGTTGGYACNVALGINASSQIVGALTSAVDGCGAWRSAFLWENGDMVDLNTLIPPGSSLKLNAAFDINDRGEIVGGGIDPSCTDPDHCNYGHAFLIVPCDEAHPGLEGCDYSPAKTDVLPQNSPEELTSRVSLGGLSQHIRVPDYRVPSTLRRKR